MIEYSIMPEPNQMVNNPILFEIKADSDEYIVYEVYMRNYHGSLYHLAFKGIIFPVMDTKRNGYYATLNIADILQPYMEDSYIESPGSLISYVNNSYQQFYVEFFQGDNRVIPENELDFLGNAFHGGISKKLLRYLTEKNTNIFDYKIMNINRQFPLTTRTSGRHIFVRETELTPFYLFMFDDVRYEIVTEYGVTFRLSVSNYRYGLYALDLEVIRKQMATLYNNIPAYFSMQINGGYCFDITVTPAAKTPNRYIIEFLNSLGMFERLEVTGKAVFEPEPDEDNAFVQYSREVDDYVEQNTRRGMREVINVESGYKTPGEFCFLRDMLMSDKRYLVDQEENKSEVRVIAENFSHDRFPTAPGSMGLKIRFVDIESNYSPPVDESERDIYFGEAIWNRGWTNSYGKLMSDSWLNTI